MFGLRVLLPGSGFDAWGHYRCSISTLGSEPLQHRTTLATVMSQKGVVFCSCFDTRRSDSRAAIGDIAALANYPARPRCGPGLRRRRRLHHHLGRQKIPLPL